MVSPKDRVKANIYKQLFEEEKKKNKRKSIFSLTLFFLGVFTNSAYQTLVKEVPMKSTISYAVNKTITSIDKKADISMEHFFDESFFDDKKIEINTDDLFGLDTQI